MNTLISFGLCPFVQRSTITMNYKKTAYDIKYIDLANKPDWFLKISPFGKVPVLQVENDVLFESAVINEYIDETTGDSLHSTDPLVKAKERAFIELSSASIFNYYQATIAQDKEGFEKNKEVLERNLGFLLDAYQGPFFREEEFSLVDCATIPLLQRLLLTGRFNELLNLSDEHRQKLNRWCEATLNQDYVVKSVPENFENDYRDYIKAKESYVLTL